MQGKSEEDWRAALKFAQKNYEKSKILHVEALPLGHVEWASIKTKKVCIHNFLYKGRITDCISILSFILLKLS